MVFEKKKCYKAYKLWGSYVGAILLFFIAPSFVDFSKNYTTFILFDYIIDKTLELVFLVLGFVIGWLIHCIFRFFKKGGGGING
ncbi:MAG: hypothetical protein AABY22_03840 [Nanoarchaeota archaeon]